MSNDLDEAVTQLEWRMAEAIVELRSSLRSLPPPPQPPPPSRSEENGGEASDEELCDLFQGRREEEPGDHGDKNMAGWRALYDLGKKHQASADAETVAGLRAKLAAWEPIIRSLRKASMAGNIPRQDDDLNEADSLVFNLPASLRPDRKPSP